MERRNKIAFVVIALLAVNLVGLTLSAADQNPRDNPLTVASSNAPGLFNVSYRSDTKGPVTLMVFDITGKYVYLKNFKSFNGELREPVDLTAYPKGIYVFEMEGDSTRETKKIVYQ